MLSALAEPSWCVCSAGLGTPAVFPRCHVAGCPSGVPLLADPLRVARRTENAPLPPLVLVVVSTSEGWGGRGGGLLLPDLRVSGGGSHLLSGPFPAVVCLSIGRPGGTGVRSLGL